MRFLLGSLLFGLSALPVASQDIIVPNSFQGFDFNILRLAYITSQLSENVQSRNNETALANLPDGKFFNSSRNQAIAGFRDGVCFFAFSGDPIPEDFTGLLPPIQDTALNTTVTGPNGVCPTVEAWRKAIQDEPYLQDLDNYRKECQKKCTGGCPLVTTGFGTGGSVAQVATIFFADQSDLSKLPTLFTYGQLPTSIVPCKVILEPARIYRFINTAEFEGRITYDPAPFFDFPGAEFAGNVIVLPPNRFEGLLTYTGGKEPLIPVEDWATENFEEVHNPFQYFTKVADVLALIPFIGFNFDALGFNGGQPCTLDEECLRKDCLSSGFCATADAPIAPAPAPTAPTLPPSAQGMIGDPCVTQADCLPSNECEAFVCVAGPVKLPFGAECEENDECASDICRSLGAFRLCFIF